METVVLTIHLLLALGLIVVVLLQRSEGGGLGIGGGGGGSLMTGRGAASALAKVTWGLGIAFVATSLVLTVLAAQQGATGSVLDRIGIDQGDVVAPGTAPDGLGDDLLPPIPPIGPSAPNAPPQGGPAAPPVQE